MTTVATTQPSEAASTSPAVACYNPGEMSALSSGRDGLHRAADPAGLRFRLRLPPTPNLLRSIPLLRI